MSINNFRSLILFLLWCSVLGDTASDSLGETRLSRASDLGDQALGSLGCHGLQTWETKPQVFSGKQGCPGLQTQPRILAGNPMKHDCPGLVFFLSRNDCSLLAFLRGLDREFFVLLHVELDWEPTLVVCPHEMLTSSGFQTSWIRIPLPLSWNFQDLELPGERFAWIAGSRDGSSNQFRKLVHPPI